MKSFFFFLFKFDTFLVFKREKIVVTTRQLKRTYHSVMQVKEGKYVYYTNSRIKRMLQICSIFLTTLRLYLSSNLFSHLVREIPPHHYLQATYRLLKTCLVFCILYEENGRYYDFMDHEMSSWFLICMVFVWNISINDASLILSPNRSK